jgi:hypothetical protein
MDQIRRDVPFYNVALHQRRVTGKKFIRNSVLDLYIQKLLAAYAFGLDLKTV